MATTDRPQLTDIPETIVEAFRASPLIGFPQLARLLGMDQTTLRDHVRAGHLPWRQKGLGKKSPRRVFTLSDVAFLLDYMQQQAILETRLQRLRRESIWPKRGSRAVEK